MYILHPTQVLGLNLETFHINSPAAAATCQTGRVDEEEEATSQEMKLIIERLILLIFLSSASNDINKKETRLPSESNHLKRSGDLLGGVSFFGFCQWMRWRFLPRVSYITGASTRNRIIFNLAD